MARCWGRDYVRGRKKPGRRGQQPQKLGERGQPSKEGASPRLLEANCIVRTQGHFYKDLSQACAGHGTCRKRQHWNGVLAYHMGLPAAKANWLGPPGAPKLSGIISSAHLWENTHSQSVGKHELP